MNCFSLKRRISRRPNVLFGTLLIICLFLAMLISLMHNVEVVQENLCQTTKCEVDKKGPRFIKDAFHIVTAAGSQEFKPLLRLIDSLSKYANSIELWIWSLDLSLCHVEYLVNLETDFKLRIEQFPYHFYPLHIRRFHLAAIKPIVLEIASKTYGEALWVNPNTVLTDLVVLTGKIGSEQGNVITDSGNTMGINYHKYERFLKFWVQCVKTLSCINKFAANETDLHAKDPLLRDFMAQYKISYESFDGMKSHDKDHQSVSLVNWEISASKLCALHEVCILTGNHQSHGCLTPQLGKLRRNKERYSEQRGYIYIEETYGFHKHGPCSRLWNKVQAILKHLPDCKILMWVDTDCVFTNIETSVESFFEKYPDKDILMNWPQTDRTLNSGVILVRNTQSTRHFFENATTGEFWSADWCRGGKGDQSGINDQVIAGTLGNRIVVKRNDHFLQGLCGLKGGKCKWKENDYIAHFAPPECPELHDFVKDFFDKYPQFGA